MNYVKRTMLRVIVLQHHKPSDLDYENSLPCSQEPATGPYPYELSPHPPTLFL
jgi:hypothetical protein